jgi:hypothetical protein
VRENAYRFVSPLQKEGIDRLEVEARDEVLLVIEADEVEAFILPSLTETTLPSHETEMALILLSPSFVRENMWRLSDGERVFVVRMEDEGFLSRVDSGEEFFSKGDVLVCRLRIDQYQIDGAIRTEYAVVRVLEHLHPPEMRSGTLPEGPEKI